ncbi:hypothetical protein ACTHPF_04270 [Paenibacillus sp. SAF-054]|uniref:hypothetical protein n=1 Tax=unclassified Paenibacillus TaxID=185978 RepID=UPI003F816FB8
MKQNKASAKWLGQPVMVVLKDGSCYIGTMSSMDRRGVTLSSLQPDQQHALLQSREKAQVSGLLSSLFFGGLTRAARPAAGRPTAGRGGVGYRRPGNGRGRGMFGMIGQIVPHIRIGMNVMRSIMPLMGLLK